MKPIFPYQDDLDKIKAYRSDKPLNDMLTATAYHIWQFFKDTNDTLTIRGIIYAPDRKLGTSCLNGNKVLDESEIINGLLPYLVSHYRKAFTKEHYETIMSILLAIEKVQERTFSQAEFANVARIIEECDKVLNIEPQEASDSPVDNNCNDCAQGIQITGSGNIIIQNLTSKSRVTVTAKQGVTVIDLTNVDDEIGDFNGFDF